MSILLCFLKIECSQGNNLELLLLLFKVLFIILVFYYWLLLAEEVAMVCFLFNKILSVSSLPNKHASIWTKFTWNLF